MSHPWWPGKIYDESLALSPLGRAKRDGSVLVSFFGDDSYAWLDHDQVIPFEPHFEEKSKMSKLQTFSVAVEEAIDELKRRAALGLTCFCRHPSNFRLTRTEGLYEVDVSGYEPGAIYSSKLIKKCADGFQPHGMFSFVKQLAMSPRSLLNVNGIINSAKVTAYRKVVFEENDETYDQAFDECEKDDEPYGQAFGVKASSSEYLAEFSKDGNQLQGTVGAQVEAATSNGPRVFVTSTEIAGLERNNSITVAKPCVDIAAERSGPAALHYEQKDKATVYRKMRRSEVSKILDKSKSSQALDKSKSSQALDVHIVIKDEKLRNLKNSTLPFDASVIEQKEKESCKRENKRKRMGENCQEVVSEVVCASSPVSSSIQYKCKVGRLDETVAAINRKYSMDEEWKSNYQQNLSAMNSSDLSLQLSNLLQKCNDILGHRTSSATGVNSSEL